MGVKVNETDSHNHTPFSMTMKGYAPRFISCVYDVLEEFDPQFIPPPDSPDGIGQVELQNQTNWIDLMSSRLDIAQDCGYGDLALAIFQKNEKRLQVVLDSGRFSHDLFETYMCERNVLHLCNTWPSGLRLLLQVERIRALLNVPDYMGLTPMDYALISSGNTCKSSDTWVECKNCSCCDGLRIFLEMDCKVVVDGNRATTLKLCSMKARRMLLQSLKNRRERLFEIATTHLELEDLPDRKTWGVKVPDVGVDLLWNKLKEKGVKLGDALDINPDLLGYFKGFFSFTHCPRVAEMAIDYGFLDADEPDSRAVTPILDLTRSPPFKLDDFLLYVDWLLQKGVNIDHSINSAKISVAHHLAQDCVDWIRQGYSTLVNIAVPRPSEHARVFLAVCTSKARSCFPCPCMTDELSLPLHHLLVHLLEDYKFWGDDVRQRKLSVIVQEAKTILALLTRVVNGLDDAYIAKSIIHTLTLQALDIKHLRECGLFSSHIHKWPEEELQDPHRQEEWNEIHDEDRLSIEKLEELTEEFEDEFLRQNIPVSDFLQDCWLPRMKQVRKEWIRPITEDQKQRLAETGVVLEDSEGFTRDLYSIEDEEEVQEGEEGDESETESSGSA
ncbi:hypothetical protein NW762_010784 [Fusarium torreyae]|uniref:Uncharacterized protein n=1 Tax=Fusarium torreyae TaxID=1237075 RepID=A0A9W8RSN4_9HYPO|nr:hypothetical protein NW762_010784 [Fusarium torreyae]